MDFESSPEQTQLREAIFSLCSRFDDAPWLRKDREGGFPEDFYRAAPDTGWPGIAMPEAYGGSGPGITEATMMMQAITESGGGLSAGSPVHMNIFGLNPVVAFGTEEQKRRAVRDGDGHIVNGRMLWISTAQVADRMLFPISPQLILSNIAENVLGLPKSY